MNHHRAAALLSCLLVVGLAPAARAQSLELAGFGGYGYGGGLTSTEGGRDVPIEGGVVYGGTLTLAINSSWRIEALYARQDSRLEGEYGTGHISAVLERFMGGIQEERGRGRTRGFGTFLIGATRFAPAGFDSQTWFTLGFGLGVKAYATKNLGLRFEARGYYTPVDSSGGAVCASGRCIFSFSGSGLFQGDVSGGVILAF
jgi:hypothetical protein